MKLKKKIIFIDMDGVLANFEGGLKEIVQDPPEMWEPGFFRNLEVMPGAKEAVEALIANPKYKVYIGSKHFSGTDYCASEKMGWLRENFPKLIKRVVLVCDKKLLRGDYLIDDDLRWKDFEGEFIHFNKHKPKEQWEEILEYLK